jgi:hypothetical protein
MSTVIERDQQEVAAVIMDAAARAQHYRGAIATSFGAYTGWERRFALHGQAGETRSVGGVGLSGRTRR